MTDERDDFPPSADLKDLAVETIHLSPEDQRRLVKLILDPRAPSSALMQAAEAHRRLMKS